MIFYKPKVFEPVIATELLSGSPTKSFSLPSGSVLLPSITGIEITAVQVTNHSHEVLSIRSVWVELSSANSNQSYVSKRAYPFDYPTMTSPEFNVIQPGDLFLLKIDPVAVPSGSRARVTIKVQSESGHYGFITQEIIP